MGQAAARPTSEDVQTTSAISTPPITLPVGTPLPTPQGVGDKAVVEEAPHVAAVVGEEGDMATSGSVKDACIGFRQSLRKMAWNVSSLEALKAAEDKLLVSTTLLLNPRRVSYTCTVCTSV